MRLLFDENLPDAIVSALRVEFPNSLHIRLMGRSGATDEMVWQLAIENNCALVTRDRDFERLSILRGAPPKINYLAVSNMFKRALVDLLKRQESYIKQFLSDEALSMLFVEQG